MFSFSPASLLSSTYTQTKKSSLSTHKQTLPTGNFFHSFSKRIFSNCLSHNSPASGWPYKFRSRGTTGSSILDQDFVDLCLGRRIQMSGLVHVLFWLEFSLKQLRLLLVLCILVVFRRHPFLGLPSSSMMMILARWIPHKILNRLYHITSEYNAAFVLLELCFKFSILEITYVQQCRKVDCSAFFSCFIDHFFLGSDFGQLPGRNFLEFFKSFWVLLL